MRRRATVVALALALASVGTATLVAGAVVSWESYSDLDNQRGALETALAVAACVGPGTRVLLHPYRRPSLHDATDPANAGGINGRLSLVPLVDVPHLQASMSALAGVSVLASGVDPRSRLVVLELDARCRYTCAHARRLVQRYAASGVEPVFVPRLDYGVSEALFADVWRAVGVAPPVRAAPLLRTLASDLVARGVGARFSATHLRLGDAQPYALANCVPRIDGGDAASLQQVAVARGVACSFGGAASSPLYVDDVLRALAFNVSRAASLFVATNKPTSVRVHALRLEAAQHGVALLTLDDVLARSGAAARARYAALVAQTGSASVLRSALEQEMCVLADAYVPCALSSWDQYVLRERAAAPPSHVPRHGAYVRDAARVSSLDELRTLWRDRERASAARADYALFVEREQAVVLECEDERRPPKSWLLLVAALLVSVAVVPASAYAYVLFRRAAFASGARAPRAHEFVARLCVAHGVLTLVECALLPTRSRAAPLIVESRLVVTALVSAAALAHAAPAWIVRAGVALVFAMSALAARALRTRAATGGALVRVLVDWRYGQEPGHVVREVVATALVCGCAAGMVALAGASAPLAGASSPSWSLARVRRDRGRAAALFAQLVLVSLALAARSCYLLASTLADDVLDVARLVLELAVLALACALTVALASDTGAVAAARANAYVTLLYSDDFVLAVRVLGASLRAVGSAYPYVCLCVVGRVTPRAARMLERDGWRTHWVDPIVPPASVQHARFRYIYTKLAVWSLGTELALERVVYVDSDTLVVRNIDHLFACGPRFCAALRSDDGFNAGVMVLATDAAFYAHVCALVRAEGTRPAGEQDLLNALLGPALRAGSFFEPLAAVNASAAGSGSGTAGMQRLSYHYNAQPDVYELYSHWQGGMGGNVADLTPAIVHYHAGNLKPWDWLPYVYFSSFWQWAAVRSTLDEPRLVGGVLVRDAGALLTAAAASLFAVALSARARVSLAVGGAAARVVLRLVALRAAYALVWCSVAPRVGLAQFCVFYACASSVLLGLVAAGSKWRRAFAEAAVLFAFLLALGAHRFDLALKAIATAVFLGAGACAAALDSSKQQL